MKDGVDIRAKGWSERARFLAPKFKHMVKSDIFPLLSMIKDCDPEGLVLI